jgi:hypothetical protein
MMKRVAEFNAPAAHQTYRMLDDFTKDAFNEELGPSNHHASRSAAALDQTQNRQHHHLSPRSLRQAPIESEPWPSSSRNGCPASN